ncbi:4'-phosphopantetheinyl transferase family protein [Streptomyces sp. NPDC055955]|uniref:4'-phosphopantetheinyl transferase family protein n=1 Tax=Streptomyces sp. NPDC055955 TaxID=3345665 RepID=UPI0035E335B8
MAPRLLDARERTRAAAFRNAEDRASYLVAHVGLRLLLGHLTGGDPARLRMGRAACPGCRGPDGRPVLVGDDLSFSLSHTRALVLLAVADVPIGVDVEAVPSASVVADTASMLPSAEQRELAELPLAARPDAFVRAWARREACGKATGTGLAHGGMERFVGTGPSPAEVGPELELHDVAAPDGYAAAAALTLGEEGKARRGIEPGQ